MFEKNIRIRVPLKLVEDLKEAGAPAGTPDRMVLSVLRRQAGQISELRDLRSSVDKAQKLVRSLRQDLEAANLELEELEKARTAANEQIASLKVEYHLMESKVRYLEQNPVVKEKVVFRENTDALAAMKRKKDELQSLAWEKEELLRRCQVQSQELKAALSKAEERGRKRFALLLTRKGASLAPGEWDLEARAVDSAEYYSWKADEHEFCKKRNIRGELRMIPIEEIKE